MKFTTFVALSRITQVTACSYQLASSENSLESNRDERGRQYIANEYCVLDHIAVPPIPFLVNNEANFNYNSNEVWEPAYSKQYCGSFHNTWHDKVNSSIVMAPVGQGYSWVVTSTRVMRDCIKLPTKLGLDPSVFTDSGLTEVEKIERRKKWKQYWNLCWQSCSYKSGGSYVTKEPPATFEFLFTPFHGPLSAKEILSSRVASSGFAEFAPTFMLLATVDYSALITLLTNGYMGNWPILSAARNTLVLTAMLEYSTHLFTYMFPKIYDESSSNSDYQFAVDFWGELGGCLQGVGSCPRIACGDTILGNVGEIANHFKSQTVLEGSLDGDSMDGCSTPFIQGLLQGVNTTNTNEETMAASVSLQLLDPVSDVIYSEPPIVGPFEELISGVCPHAWYASDNDAAGFATLINDMVDDGTDDMTFDVRCNSDANDIYSNRIMLPTDQPWQYRQSIMYMPSELEVYSFKQWMWFLNKEACRTDTSLDCFDPAIPEMDATAVTKLLLVKLRFRNHGAEHHAAEDLNNFNSRALSSEECGGDQGSYDDISNAVSFPADNQEPCVYMHFLLMITEVCSGVTKKNANHDMCQENVKKVLLMLSIVCDSTCNSNIMSDYFCTSVSVLSGSTCNKADELYYWMSSASVACDPWYQEFSPDYCSSSGFGYQYGSSGYTDQSDQTGAYYMLQGDYQGYDGYNFYDRARKLSHDITYLSSFKDIDSIDNLIALQDFFLASADSEYSLISFPTGWNNPATVVTVQEYESEARAGLNRAYNFLVSETLPSAKTRTHPDRVTLLSTGLKDVLTTDELGSSKYSEIRDLFGEFIRHTSIPWSLSIDGYAHKFVPIFPMCDVEFEESLVRDALQLKSAVPVSDTNDANDGVLAGLDGPCKYPPYHLSASMVRKMLEGRYARHRARFFW